MTVWIVLKNGKVDDVFADPAAADLHRRHLQANQNVTRVIVKEIRYVWPSMKAATTSSTAV